MESKKLTIADFAKQIDTYLFVFVAYCNTFDIDLFNKKFFVDASREDLTLDREIKQELINYFTPKKDEILEYRYDYFTNKSIEDIAKITGANPARVVAYLERNKHNFKSDNLITGLSQHGDVTLKSRIKDISSYAIMQHFQLMDRQLVLSNSVKTRNILNRKPHLITKTAN